MHGAAKPSVHRVKAGEVLVRQGEPGSRIYLVLDGVLRVDRNGERLAEYGPGHSWANVPTSRAAREPQR